MLSSLTARPWIGSQTLQGVPESQAPALPRHQEEEETDKTKKKHKSNKRTKSTNISPLFPKRGNRNAKRTEKHKNKISQDKTWNKLPRGGMHFYRRLTTLGPDANHN